MPYTHFTLEERKYLQQLLSEGKSFQKIGAILGRSVSSISREVKRNRSQHRSYRKHDNQYCYNHWRANTLYICRRREQNRQAIKPGTPEWEYIISGLQHYWSPETICGRWHKEFPERKPLCVSTIYRYIKLGKFPKITAKQHLRRRGKRIQTRNANYNSIQPDRTIPEWPDEVRNRIRIGDWEGDTVYGGVGKGLLVTLVDRKSRHLKMGLLAARTAEGTRKVIEKLLCGLLPKINAIQKAVTQNAARPSTNTEKAAALARKKQLFSLAIAAAQLARKLWSDSFRCTFSICEPHLGIEYAFWI